MKLLMLTVSALWLLGATGAGGAESGSQPSAHVQADIQRHRAMALAHETTARCLEAGRSEEVCLADLQKLCKGLAIGKYCGMKHEH